jgi:predicted negative regulator of RcsB-dependent stress response
MLRNKIYIGDTYMKLGKKEEAAEWYEKATKFNAIAESDKQLLEEAKKKLASTKSSSWW